MFGARVDKIAVTFLGRRHMPDDRARILHRLQAALRHETLTALCYDIHADRAKAAGREEIALRLGAVGEAHRRHIEALEDRIRDLGGHPNVTAPPESLLNNGQCHPEGDLLHALEHDLRAEDTEIEEYEVLAGQSDDDTANLCGDIIDDDRSHLAWLREEVVRERNLGDPED